MPRASVWPIWSTSERAHLRQHINSEIGPFVLTPVTPSPTCGLNYTWFPALCYRTRGPRVPPRPWTWHDPDCDFADSRVSAVSPVELTDSLRHRGEGAFRMSVRRNLRLAAKSDHTWMDQTA